MPHKNYVVIIILLLVFIAIPLAVEKTNASNDNVISPILKTDQTQNRASVYQNESCVDPNAGGNEINDFTLLIYIIGSSLEDESYEATKDIQEMLKNNVYNPKVNIVLETGGSEAGPDPDNNRTIDFSVVQRHVIENKEIKTVCNLGLENMGKTETLSDFLIWGVSNYPAKKYGLILWDHGSGVQGFGNDVNFDDANFMKDSLNLYELTLALSQFKMSFNNFNFFEFVGFDSCLMSTLEVGSFLNFAYPSSKFLIASEETEPNWGWNYSHIINVLKSNPDISGKDLGEQIALSYANDSKRISKQAEFYADRDITLSVVNLTKLPHLNQILSNLVISARNEITNQGDLLKLIRGIDTTERFGESISSSYGMLDFDDFLSNLARSFPSLTNQINQVRSEINSSVVYNYSGEAHPNARGISIFLPLSVSDLKIIDRLSNMGYTATNNLNWLIFINWVGGIISTDKFSPVVQSVRNGNSIYVHLSDPDIHQIYASYTLKSRKGDPILYIQNLDPNLMNESGFFKYEPRKMLALCNEKLCSPVSVIMSNTKNLKKIFIPIELQSESGNREISLVYEYRNNNFLFLGGIDEFKVRGGQSIPKEKVSLEPGDIIIPKGLKGNYLPFYIKDSNTIKDRIVQSFNNFVADKSLTVTDPGQVKPKFIEINQSDIKFTFCDFSDFCDNTRTYHFDTHHNLNAPETDQLKTLIFNNTNVRNSNLLTYSDPKYGFQVEYPSDWYSVPQSEIYISDPNILSLFPADEISNSNGSSFSLINNINIIMEEINQSSPKFYFDYFNNPDTKEDLKLEMEYEILNSSNLIINGHPAFEFILKSQKFIPGSVDKDAVRLGYWVTVPSNGKIYAILFEAETSKFYKYLPIVKSIISSFKPINVNEIQNVANQTYYHQDENDISRIRELMSSRLLSNIIWKEYNDLKYNFTLLYPYIDRFNNPVAQQMPNDDYFLLSLLPSVNYLDHPYKNPNLQIVISNNNQSFDETNFFKHVILNSTTTILPDGSLASVNERKYFLPLLYQWVYEKKTSFHINNKFVSISIVVPYDNYPVYVPTIDKIVQSFKFYR